MVYDTAKILAREMQDSSEYATYAEAKERAMENETTKALINEYHRLQVRAQAATVSGADSAEIMKKLQKVGEVLQFDAVASAYLLAEFQVNRMLADVYKILADAVQIDLSALEA